jgi:hypothetical protein
MKFEVYADRAAGRSVRDGTVNLGRWRAMVRRA